MSNNRPSAVRTAGTVGRWGMTSFTSTRAIGKISGLESYSSHSNTSYMFNVSAEAPEDDNSHQAAVPEVTAPSAPKPRKFFKSRAAAQSTSSAAQQQQPESYVPPQPAASTVVVPEPLVAKPSKTKHKKKTAIQEYYVSPPPQPEPVFIPQPSASQDRIRETIPSKRYLARARKVVNYNEDDSQSQPAAPPPLPPPAVQPMAPIIVPISAVSPSMEHPPIVLRISNGTSRLISTDSEEANNASPPHQTFSNPPSGGKETTTGDSPARQTASLHQEKPAAATHTPRTRRSVPAAVVTPPTSDAGPRRTTRAIRRQQEEEELRSEQEQTACEEEDGEPIPKPHTPVPGSDNYDLYKTLASSPEEVKEAEEDVVVPGSVKVTPEPTPIVANVQTKVPAKRGRKKKVDVAVVEPPPVVTPPVIVPAPPPPPEVAPVPETPSPTPPTKAPTPARRGRKPKAAAEPPPAPKEMGTPKKQPVAEEPQSPSVRRSTRGGGGQVTPVKMQKMDNELKAGALPIPEEPPVVTVASPAKPEPKPPVRSYARKRKAAVEPVTAVPDSNTAAASSPQKGKKFNGSAPPPIEKPTVDPIEEPSEVMADEKGEMDKPAMKLVISKKKGSIFKSRALVSEEEVAKNRPVYKHKWDVAEEDRNSPKGASSGGDLSTNKQKAAAFDGDFDEAEPKASSASSAATVFKPHRRLMGNSYGAPGAEKKKSTWKKYTSFDDDDDEEDCASPKKSRNAFYTIKQAHQIQENGEFQEMDDEVEYILDMLQPKYPILTRCLSALQLSTKCMSPEFRMHVRAHGTVTQFFSVLQDAPKDRSLGLCTATIMFVLAQDNIGMDLDKDSLELMLNLLECDVGGEGELQLEKNRLKVRKLCEEIKALGKAPHLNVDTVSAGTLAMETLLTLTSKRAGEWFKEELRNLGGLEHIVKTICECCRQISDYVAVWTEGLLEKLRKIERCLRVLENVMEMNEQNQSYILTYDQGNAINVLVKLYKLCDTEIALYPTTVGTPKDNHGVVIREALMPTLKVLISLTHPFNDEAVGARIVGEKVDIFDTSLHLLFHSSNYVPEDCIFDLSLLVLLLLTNLTTYTVPNRTKIMEANVQSDFGSQFAKVPAIKALVEFFYKCEESARLAEENADALLDSKPKKELGDEVKATVVDNLIKKAGNQMEHTVMASYVCLLMGHLVSQNEENRAKISAFLRPDAGFGFMAKILEKYLNFMNLTATSEATTVQHMESTKKIIDCLNQCDGK